MEIIDRLVEFGEYCSTCKYEKTEEKDEPCCECLDNPTNIHTNKPIKWVEGKKKKTQVEKDEKGS